MTGVSTLGQALDQIERIKEQQNLLSALSTQIATGKKTQVFSGLGSDALISQRARTDINSLNAYGTNITNADRRISLTVNAIQEFKTQAESFHSALITFSQQSVHQEGDPVLYDDPLTLNVNEATVVGQTSGEPDGDMKTLQNLASSLFDFMTSLLNSKDGNRYLLGGAETLTPPIQKNGLLDAAMNSALSNWKNGTITTDNLMADLQDRTTANGNPDAFTDTTIGYNAQLSSGNVKDVFAKVDDTSDIKYTVLANEDPFRDIMTALAYIKNPNLAPVADVYAPGGAPYPAPPSQQGAPGATLADMRDSFFKVFSQITNMVQKGIDGLDQISARIENVHAQIDDAAQTQKAQQSVLLSTVSDVENIDTSEAAVRLTSLQTQLQASFSITARMQDLSLVNFIKPF